MPQHLHEAQAIKLTRFATLSEAKSYLAERQVPIIGVEIVDGARSIEDMHLDHGPLALLMGNEVGTESCTSRRE